MGRELDVEPEAETVAVVKRVKEKGKREKVLRSLELVSIKKRSTFTFSPFLLSPARSASERERCKQPISAPAEDARRKGKITMAGIGIIAMALMLFVSITREES